MSRLLLMAALFCVIALSSGTVRAQGAGDGGAAAGADQLSLLSKQIRHLEERLATLQKMVENQPRLDHLYYSDRHRSSIEELADSVFIGGNTPREPPKDWFLSPDLTEKFAVPKEAVAVQLEIRLSANLGPEPPAGAKSRVRVDVQAPNKKGRVFSAVAEAPDSKGESSSDMTLMATVFIEDGKFAVRVEQECVGDGSGLSRDIQIMGYLMPPPAP